MKITLIAAMDQARAIGRQGDLPWRLPDDLARFKRLTLGKPIILGRKTWASIGRPLPGRTNIILTHNHDLEAPGCLLAHSLPQALEMARQEAPESVTIGGGQAVYAEALPLATHMHLTQVHTRIEDADTWFPAWDHTQWRVITEEFRPEDERHAYAMTWQDLAR